MTDVGKISLGVEIDADALSARLGEAVRKAIAPALAQVQAELNKVEREYAKAGRAAEKSNAAQTAGAKAVAEAVEKVGKEQDKQAAKTKTASAISVRSINSVTRALDRQAAAWSRLAAAQTAAAAAPQPDAPGGGGGGTRGPPNAGVNAGGFMRGGKGRFGFLTSPVGLNLISQGVGALPAALTGVTNLVGAVQQLGQAGLALPAIYGAAGASIGVAVLGFKGMGDAVKALNEAAKSGDPKDLEKATEALKDMDPAAVAVAKTVSGLTQGPLKDLQKMVAGRMFAGFDKDLQGLSDKAVPRLTGNLGKMGDAWNTTLKQVTGSLGAEKNLSLIDRFLGNTAEGQKRASAAIDPIVHAFATLMSTGGEFLPRLGDALTKVATRFDNFISKAGASGQLWKWIDEGLNGLRALGNSIINIGKSLFDLTKAAGGDGGFLGWLEKATGRMHDFTSSAEGQGKLRDFFKNGRADLREWGDLLSKMAPILLHILEGFGTWGQIMLPVISALTSVVAALDKIPGLLEAVVVGFMAWRTLGPIIGGLTTKLDKFSTAAAGASGAGPGGKGKGRFAGKGTGLLVGGSLLAAGTASQISGGADSGLSQALGAAETIGGAAVLGGTIGSVVPGVGTAVGAGVGAGVGAVLAGVNFLMGENAQKADEAAAAQQRFADQMATASQATDIMAAAQKSLEDALLASKGALDDTAISAISEEIGQLPDKLAGIPGVADALKNLNLTTEQLATITTGAQPGFDALISRLEAMGPAGQAAAEQLALIRDNTKFAADNAATAGPMLEHLAEVFNTTIPQAAANVQNIFAAIPHDVPLNVNMTGVDGPGGALDLLKQVGAQLEVNANGEIHVTAPLAPEVLRQLEALGVQIKTNADGTINVQIPEQQYLHTLEQLGQLGDAYKQLFAGTPALPNVPVTPPPPQPQNITDLMLPPGGHRAGGGVLPGWSPGRDNMLVAMAGGEGVLIPEAARGLGGQAGIAAINRHFKGHANGGIVGFDDGGVVPHLGTGLPPGPETEIDLLRQIRDLLAGKGGAGTPLSDTATNTGKMATAASKASQLPGTTTGPFGTPIKPRNRGYEMAAAAISALGGDPEKFLGPDPVAYMEQQLSASSSTIANSGLGGGTTAGNPASFAAALTAFAGSGNLQDVLGLGLDANDPVVKAIVAARNKKKGGLSDEQIGTLVDQVLAGGGFTGVLDESNTSLVSALQTFREKVLKGKVGAVPGTTMTGNNATGLNWQALAQAESGGNWSINTGNGYFGGLQFDQATWDAYKPAGAPARADLASPEQQIAAAQNAINQRGGPQSLWPQNWQKLGGGATTPTSTSGMPFVGNRTTAVKGSKAGLQPAASNLFDVISQYFPQIGEIGGVRQDALPFHPSGRALDIMIPGAGGLNDPTPPGAKALGDSIYQFLMANASQLGIDTSGTLWQQKDHFNHIHAQLLDGVQQFTNAGLAAPGATGALGAAGAGGATPVFVTNWPGGGGTGADFLKSIAGAGIDAVGQAGMDVGSDIGQAVAGIGQEPWAKRAPNVKELSTLIKERNPLALAQAMGFNVEDFTRQGGAGTDLEKNAGPGFDATGRLFSDTSALFDRTLSSLTAQLQAMREQMVDVIEQVSQKLEESALEPVVKAGVQSALEDLKSVVSSSIGTALGEAAAPPIAEAVSSAVANLPIDNSGAGGVGNDLAGAATAPLGGLFATGGGITGGTPGVDSVPILAQHGEYVLDPHDVARMGGFAGVDRFRKGLARSGGIRGYATGGGVIGNDTVGAEFFGVSEVPIIGAIVNLLVRVLLQVIGVEIEVRDTLNEMSTDFRTFRGDAFKAFDAQGRLMNDTSALIERSATSEETAAEERIRILKIVIQAIIKYIIEKVIVPITKAVANAAIQAGASAAGAAVNTQAPGAGGIVSSLISSAGQAGVEIAAEIGTDFALALSEQLIDITAEGLQSAFPDIITSIFSGAGLATLFDPAGGLLTTILGGLLSAFTVLLGGGVLGGAATMIPGDSLFGVFDEGGMATGTGYLPKATADPELVLSPEETTIFSRFVAALERGGFGGNRTVHAPITVLSGGPETAEQVENRLLKLMP